MDVYPDLYFAVWSFLMGAVVGSFLNVVIHRLPLELSLVRPGSSCPSCRELIRWYDNIPILSWVFLLGRCRWCRCRISIRYPFVEAATGALALGLYHTWGLSLTTAVLFGFSAAMIAVFWIDLDHMIIPDVISVNGIVLGVIASQLDLIPWMTWRESLMGTFLGGGILYGLAVGYERLRGMEGLGGGDIKLLAMIGAFTGPYGVMFVLLVSSFAGSLAAFLTMAIRGVGATTPIPFGPFLSGAAILFLFVGQEAISRFLEFSPFGW
jgi:leader peptidase (prepilin peptidase) / N-methyltransferase